MNVVPFAGRTRTLGGALVLAVTLVTVPAVAQSPSAMNPLGDLSAMPFEPDIPVTRTTVERDGDELRFNTVTSLSYEATVEHYRQHYARRTELAPGWRLLGLGFDVGQNCWTFTLNYAAQTYRLEVRPDSVGGGAIVTLRGRARTLGFQPRVPTVAPYRAADVGPVTYR